MSQESPSRPILKNTMRVESLRVRSKLESPSDEELNELEEQHQGGRCVFGCCSAPRLFCCKENDTRASETGQDPMTLKDALSAFAGEIRKEITRSENEDFPSKFSLFSELVYYHPRLSVKCVAVLIIILVLVLLVVFEFPLAVVAIWSLCGGLAVVSIVSAEVAKRVRSRLAGREDKNDVFAREWRCRAFEHLKALTQEGARAKGSYVILVLFLVFGGCSIFIVDDETSALIFLILFGIFGLLVVLLIGFHAWNDNLGVESYIIVEAIFDILLSARLSSDTAETASIVGTIALAGIAVVCALVRLHMRMYGEERDSEIVLLVAFLTTDAADVVILGSQLLISSGCDVDPKVIVVAGLLTLNPCVTELISAFKSDKEKDLARDIRTLLGDPKRDKEKLKKKKDNLAVEQAKRWRMENKSVVQTVVVGLGVFALVYALFLVERETRWYWLFVPLIVLLVYVVDSQACRYAWSRKILNRYFYATSFRLFSACWALLLALSPLYADNVPCGESTAFLIWAGYSIAPLLVVTVIKSVQREELLTPLGKEKYEDFVPKIIRPARADLAAYYVDKLNAVRRDEVRQNRQNRENGWVRKILELFSSSLRFGHNQPLVIHSLLDATAYVIELAEDARVEREDLPPAAKFSSMLWKYYGSLEDDEPLSWLRGSLERTVITLALRSNAKVLKEIVDVVKLKIGVSGKFGAMLNERARTLHLVLARYDHAEVLFRLAIDIGKAEAGEPGEAVARYLNNLAELYAEQVGLLGTNSQNKESQHVI